MTFTSVAPLSYTWASPPCAISSPNSFGIVMSVLSIQQPVFFCPLLYAFSLRLSALLLSFEAAFWRREFICFNFCSREYGCNDMICTSLNAAMLL